MMRRCDGTDPNLVRGDERKPCDCGLAFDDEDRRVVFPHDPIPVDLLDVLAATPPGPVEP